MFRMGALELGRAIRAGEIGVVETVRARLAAIEEGNPRINAFTSVAGEAALKRAEEVQTLIDRGEAESPLAGVPVAVKDNIHVRGMPTSCASRLMGGFVPEHSAEVVDRIERAGMVILGKLNMDEFAMGGSGGSGAFGQIRNPRDLSRVPGGSSGGSAAAVASGMVPLALGSDTGGSIRQPCAFCGISGIKPSFGAVSHYGLVPLAPSLDNIGPMAGNVDDCAALLAVISGPDPRDPTCTMAEPFRFGFDYRGDLSGLRIGLLANCLAPELCDGEVRLAVLAAAGEFRAAGALVTEFDMPLLEYMVPTYCAVVCSEAFGSLARYEPGNPEARAAFGIEVKRRLMFGSLVLSQGFKENYHRKAMQVRSALREAYRDLFRRFDLLLSPVSPGPAYRIGESMADPMKAYSGDMFLVSANLAGLPAAAVPAGTNRQGLPLGFQLVGDAFGEPMLVAAARVYQERTGNRGPGAEF
ncbi:MAG: aspartyl/glutamyl-tRNA amidotransferase subunit A [Treponema sp.]|nr:aspartyl/glutamyl-tRNA amidotransferase subunit A [Treponema sp.]